MAWIRLRDRVIINAAELASVEVRSSSGMDRHTGGHTPGKLKTLDNLCFTMTDGSLFVRYFLPTALAVPVLEDIYRLLVGSRVVVDIDAVLDQHGIRPEDTY